MGRRRRRRNMAAAAAPVGCASLPERESSEKVVARPPICVFAGTVGEGRLVADGEKVQFEGGGLEEHGFELALRLLHCEPRYGRGIAIIAQGRSWRNGGEEVGLVLAGGGPRTS